MEQLYRELTDYLDGEGWHYSEEAGGALLVSFEDFETNGSGEHLGLLAQVEASQWIVFTSFAPLEVPEEYYLDALAFLNAANGRVARGNFYLDVEGDSLQFTTTVDGLDVEGHALPSETLQMQMHRAVEFGQDLLSGFYPHLCTVAEGGDPEQAFIEALEEFSGDSPSD